MSDRSELEDRIRTGLGAVVEDGPSPSDRYDGVEARQRHHERLLVRRRVLVGAAATAAVGGGLGLLASRDASEEEQDVAVGPNTSVTEPGTWEHIEEAPLSQRSRPFAVWAGDRLVVWGGALLSGGFLHPPDGAAWASGAGDWTPMAVAPAGASTFGFAVWDGRQVLVGPTEADSRAPWNLDASPADARYGLAAYDPAEDAWRYVAPLDATRPFDTPRQAVVVGPKVYVAARFVDPSAEGHDDDLIAYDTATGAMSRVPPGPFASSPYSDGSGEVSLTKVAGKIVAVPNWDLRPWVLDVESLSWAQAPPPPSATSLHLMRATWVASDSTLMFESDGPNPQPWLFDPSRVAGDPWREGTPNPFDRARWDYEPVWSGRELFVPGAAYDPTDDTWREVAPPPRDTGQQRTLQSAWTGNALLLFGGEQYECPDNATCDRATVGPDRLDGWLLPE